MALTRKRQQELFRTLGTLRRTQIVLMDVVRPTGGNNTPALKLTPLQQRVIDAATYVLNDLYKICQDEMHGKNI